MVRHRRVGQGHLQSAERGSRRGGLHLEDLLDLGRHHIVEAGRRVRDLRPGPALELARRLRAQLGALGLADAPGGGLLLAHRRLLLGHRRPDRAFDLADTQHTGEASGLRERCWVRARGCGRGCGRESRAERLGRWERRARGTLTQ
eukprot:6948034-Prymnesium_polylepis.1